MMWNLSWRADPRAKALADRHYNRQNPDSAQFVPPGRCLVLLTATADALWVTSWPQAEYVKHAWPGAWICSAFRNEGPALSSALITQAVAATRARWDAPALGMVTFVDPQKTRPKRDPGYCFLMAGFEVVGRTKEQGLVALQLLPDRMPAAAEALGSQLGFDDPCDTPKDGSYGQTVDSRLSISDRDSRCGVCEPPRPVVSTWAR